MNFMLVGILILVIFIIALSARVPGNPHKNIILENTIQKEHLEETKITELRQEYKRRLLQIAAVLSLVSLPLLLSPYDSIMMLGFIVIMMVSIASMFYCEVTYIRKMKQLIVENHWTVEVTPIVIDTTLVVEKNRKMLSAWWLLPAIFVSVFGCLYTFRTLGTATTTWIFIITAIVVCGLFIALYYSLGRLPVKSYTTDKKLNGLYNDLFRHHWSVILIVLFWLLAPISFLPVVSLQENYHSVFLLMMFYMILIIMGAVFTIYYLYDLRKKQDQIIEQAPEYQYTGDDDYWKFSVYINPNDSRLMVADCLGMNVSMNLGKKSGKIIAGILGILVTGLLFVVLIPLFMIDFGQDPFQATLSNEEVQLQAPLTHAKIPIDDIEDVVLLDKLPSDRIRMNGTGTEHYQLGEFKVENRTATLLVDNSSSPVLKIQTKKRDYYFTSKISKETKLTYKKLKTEIE